MARCAVSSGSRSYAGVMPDKIVLAGIHKNFTTDDGVLPVIANVDLAVADGEFVPIVGPSGCGKTTLLNIIAGFVRPDSGDVKIDGVPRNGPNPRGIVISQRGSVFPWLTVQQNVMFGLHGSQPEKRALADHYAAVVGLKG